MKKKLDQKTKNSLIQRCLGRKSRGENGASRLGLGKETLHRAIPDTFTRLDCHPGYKKIQKSQDVAKHFRVLNPFFREYDGVAGAKIHLKKKEYINFSTYNYLDLAGHPEVNTAAKEAIDRYGTSASASRVVAGERPVQRELEKALAQTYEVDDCVVFVSGHATNVSTIGILFGSKDLIIHDQLIHNSVLEGIKAAGSARRSFLHNNLDSLDTILQEIRGQFERVLIVVEGLYSMDGDLPNLPALIDLKKKHKAFLMVDEAHSFGILGKTGRGIREHYGVEGQAVDIWMGTFSKTLAGCGGFIAGEHALIQNLKYFAPGFVYSVGMSPPLAAASLAALRIMLREPERVTHLREVCKKFLQQMKAININTGYAQGYAVVPAIIGSSLKATQLSNTLFDAGINVQPIIHPAVEEKSARLRFFLSTMHSEEDLHYTVSALQKIMA